MAASSSGSNKCLSSNLGKEIEVISADPRPRSSEDAEPCACDSFCRDLQKGIIGDRSCQANHGHGSTATSSVPTRKAEREKLRRDRLNEQLLVLADALGQPDRPKNDKSTILGDAIETLKELIADVERLRAENSSLADESKDLCQEKKELHEERQQLTSKVQQLQSRASQQMNAMLFWMTADPGNMTGAYAVRLPSSQRASEDLHPRPPQMQVPFVGHQPMPPMPAPLAVHPGLQACYRYNGHCTPYFPFQFENTNDSSLETDERCARVSQGYPRQVQQMLTHQMPAIMQAAACSQAYGSHYPFQMAAVSENPNSMNASRILADGSTGHNQQNPGSNCLEPWIKEHLRNMEQHHISTMQLSYPASLSAALSQESHQAVGISKAK